MAVGALAGLRLVSFEARRAEELATMLVRHGAEVVRAPALREEPLGPSAATLELARRLEAGEVDLVVLLTGVGTRALAAALADACPYLGALLARTRIVARGPKPLAALRELGVAGAHPVPEPFTWRQVLEVVDGLGVPRGGLAAVQEYGAPVPGLVDGLVRRGLRVLSVPVYRWALPEDVRPLATAAAALACGEAEVAVFTNAAQVEHLFRAAADPEALRRGLAHAVVASVGPVCTEALEAHGIAPDLEASPPKMGPLVGSGGCRSPTARAKGKGYAGSIIVRRRAFASVVPATVAHRFVPLRMANTWAEAMRPREEPHGRAWGRSCQARPCGAVSRESVPGRHSPDAPPPVAVLGWPGGERVGTPVQAAPATASSEALVVKPPAAHAVRRPR